MVLFFLRTARHMNCQQSRKLFFGIHQNFQGSLAGAQIEGFAPLRNRQLFRDHIVQPHASLRENLHHPLPGFRGVTNGTSDLELLVKNLIDWKLDLPAANPNLSVSPHGPQRVQATPYRIFVPGALEGCVYAPSIAQLTHHIHNAPLRGVDSSGSSETESGVQTAIVPGSASHDGLDALRHQQLHAQKSHGTRAGYQRNVADADFGQLNNRFHHGGEWFAERGFVQRQIRRNAVELIRTHHHVASKTSVHAMAHAPAVRTKYEIAGNAVRALAAGNGCGSQAGHPFANARTGNLAADFHYGAGEFVAENYRRIIAKSILEDVNIRSTQTAKGDFDFDLRRPANRFVHIQDVDVTRARREFNEGFHSGPDSSGNASNGRNAGIGAQERTRALTGPRVFEESAKVPMF